VEPSPEKSPEVLLEILGMKLRGPVPAFAPMVDVFLFCVVAFCTAVEFSVINIVIMSPILWPFVSENIDWPADSSSAWCHSDSAPAVPAVKHEAINAAAMAGRTFLTTLLITLRFILPPI
jgi:hypothetical protein